MDHQRRKELVTSYKQSHRPMGIYQIRNKINGKIFLGSSVNLDGIINRNQFMLNFGSHVNRTLQEDWKTFGAGNFSFDILDQIKPQEEFVTNKDEMKKYEDELEVLEQLWLEKLQPFEDKGYNKKVNKKDG